MIAPPTPPPDRLPARPPTRPPARRAVVRRAGLALVVGVAALTVALPAAAVGASRDDATATKTVAAKRAKNACKILTRSDIESVLDAAPLDPGPTTVKIPNVRKRFTRCEWDDRREPKQAQLAVYTGLARKLDPEERLTLGVAAPGSPARNLTPEELTGLGDWGAVEIIRDGTYGSISVVRGAHSFFVSAAYQGPGAPLVSEADMLALARLAAEHV